MSSYRKVKYVTVKKGHYAGCNGKMFKVCVVLDDKSMSHGSIIYFTRDELIFRRKKPKKLKESQ